MPSAFRLSPSALISVLAAAVLCAAAPAHAFGPILHTLTAYQTRNESAVALGKLWGFKTDRTALAAIMAGALVHDLGYSTPRFKLFSDLVHYQETGAFVDRYLGAAVAGGRREVVAFGLGLALHHAGDRQGHDGVTNRVVARLAANKTLALGKLAYEDGMDAHTCVERWLDAIAIADRKLLPEQDLEEFLLVLDGTAGFADDREGGLLALALAPLSTAVEITYGVALPLLVEAGTVDAAYLGLPNAYRRSLRGAEIAIGIAEELYGLKVDYSKLRVWQKVPVGILEHFYKECGPLRPEVEKIVKETGWLGQALERSTRVYGGYLAGLGKTPVANGAARTIWAPGKTPPAVNLDTNLLSAAGEYRLADAALDALNKMGGKIATATEYANLKMTRSGSYFEKADPKRIERQVLALDRMEREANGLTAPGRASPPPLPNPLPRFRIGPTQNCQGAAVRLSATATVRVSQSQVCLSPGSNVLAAWIGALAAATPAERAQTYRDTCYAYFPRTAKSAPADLAQCR